MNTDDKYVIVVMKALVTGLSVAITLPCVVQQRWTAFILTVIRTYVLFGYLDACILQNLVVLQEGNERLALWYDVAKGFNLD